MHVNAISIRLDPTHIALIGWLRANGPLRVVDKYSADKLWRRPVGARIVGLLDRGCRLCGLCSRKPLEQRIALVPSRHRALVRKGGTNGNLPTQRES